MKENLLSRQQSNRLRWPWILAAACILVLLFALRQSARKNELASRDDSTNPPRSEMIVNSARTGRAHPSARLSHSQTSFTAKEIVANKLAQFGKSRRKLVHALAMHLRVEVPGDVERFFDAVESGRWEEIDAAHNALLLPGAGFNQPRSAELHQIWRAIQETWGAAREAHTWPAQKLLDYGEAVLGSLRPGMIYVGGTDPGCFIPTFLNETSEGEHHITLTQNALADDTYLDYLNFLHGNRMTPLTKDDSQRAFQEYTADAQKRFQHDQQFPDESKQLRPGEDVRMIDGKVQVSGQVAVMAINEKLLQTLMQKNPDASFAMEESFPFNSMFANAAPLGPIMELGVRGENNALTRERATQSVDYWRATAQQLLADPDSRESAEVLKSYSKLVSSQGGLFASHHYTAEAEQAFRLAAEICPYSPEAVFRLVNLLVEQNRFEDAIPVAENAVKVEPQNQQFRSLVEQLKSTKKN